MRILRRRDIVMLRTNGGDHPCIMLTDPFKRKGKGRQIIIQVSLTTSEYKHDPTCVFLEGEGRVIMAGSCVVYAAAEIKKLHELQDIITRRNRTVRTISHAAYLRIIEGLLQSEVTDPKVKKYFLDALRQGKAG